ncbi:MAG: heparinase II/III family protein [Planctomycetes bacterium]|nr:heparinase II/III family protein [Planctomycetota bacterium]
MRAICALLVVAAFGPACVAGAVRAAKEVSKPVPRIPDGAWADTLSEHPRLLGPKQRLAERARTMPQFYAVVRSHGSLVAAGIANAVDGIVPERIDKYIADAASEVAKGVTNIHQTTWVRLTKVAETYDFFHDSISAEDRRAMIVWMNAHLEAYKGDETAFHNSTLSKILCYLRIAYATWGENPRAEDFRDYALINLYEGKVVPLLNEFGAGGGFTECGWYGRHSLWHLVQALELARRFEGYDGFAKAPRFFYQRLAYEMLQPYPGLWVYGSQRFACEGDGSLVFGGSNTYPMLMRNLLAQYFSGSDLACYVRARRVAPPTSHAKVADFLWDEGPQEKPLDVNTFPKAHLASGIGRVYARSDWTDDASWLRFECGDYFVGHQHFEVGNFEIFRYEPLAAESGEYVDYGSDHSVNYLLRTIAHNCILVYQPGEIWTRLRDGGRHPYANDGGQTKKWEWTVGTLEEWKAKRDTFERGDIVAYENRPEYMFVAGDCTKAYSPSKLSLWIRQIVFVRPHKFIIFDRVVSTKPEYQKTWLLHSFNEPYILGNILTIKNGKGTLHVQTLLPEKQIIESIRGYTYGGETYDERKSAQSNVAARWRTEVKPAEARREDIFLNVLSTDGPVEATLIHRGTAFGVFFDDVEVVFEGHVGGYVKVGSKTFALDREVKTGEYE